MDYLIIKNKCSCANIRKKYKKIIFNNGFDEPINEILFADHIESIKFGYWFNQDISDVEWPKSLKKLVFTGEFNHPIDELPDTINILELSDGFNCPIKKLPPLLKKIVFGNNFNQQLDNIVIPSSLETIIFGDSFDNSLNNIIFPDDLIELHLGKSFNSVGLESLPNVQILKILNINKNILNLPITLKKLIIMPAHNKFIEKIPFGCIIENINNINNQIDEDKQTLIKNKNIKKELDVELCNATNSNNNGFLHYINNITNNESVKIVNYQVLNFDSNGIINLLKKKECDNIKIKGFIVNFTNLYELNKINLTLNIGCSPILSMPFSLCALLSKDNNNHEININTAYLEFNNDFYIKSGIDVFLLSAHSTQFMLNRKIDFELKIILECSIINPHPCNSSKSIVRNVSSFYTNEKNYRISLGIPGLFIAKNIDNIENLKIYIGSDSNLIEKINYDHNLVKINGKKINNLLFYLPLDGSTNYNSLDTSTLVPGSLYDYIQVIINNGELIVLYLINLNVLQYKSGLGGVSYSYS